MSAVCVLGAVGAMTGGMWQAASAAVPQPVGKLLLSPLPIAPTGSLKAKASVSVIVTAESSGGVPLGGAAVYLSFVPTIGGGTATAHNLVLTSTPVLVRTDTAGTVKVRYRAPVAPVPKSGTDTLTAANAPTTPTVSASDTYTFAKPVPPVTSLTASPSPIAPAKSLVARTSVTVTITAMNGVIVVPRADVYVSFQPAVGGGVAASHDVLITSTPQLFKADATGALKVIYRTSSTVPTSGTDTITFANAATGATVTGTDTYSF